ncbi:MAG: hypothetical protein J7599_17235 [Niabella sp.]|nr:hypothetical protein [Niabella sp.]
MMIENGRIILKCNKYRHQKVTYFEGGERAGFPDDGTVNEPVVYRLTELPVFYPKHIERRRIGAG